MSKDPQPESAADRDRSVIVFSLAGADYALPAEEVDEVLRMVALTPLPEGPRWLAGILNLRGAVAPVVDLRVRLSVDARDWDLSTPILVARPGWTSVGLIADSVVGMEMLPVEPLAATDPRVDSVPLVRAVARGRTGRLIPVLDLAAVCAGVEGVVGVPA